MKKHTKNIILVVFILILIIGVFLSSTDFNKVINALGNVKFLPMLIAFLVVVCYLIVLALSLVIIERKKTDNKISFMDSFNIANSQNFYNGITPFQAGGQPLQFYYYTNKGMSKHKAAAILVVNFTLYQLALTIVSIIAMCLYFNYLKNNIEGFTWALITGFTINLSILIGLILIGTSKRFKNLCVNILKLLSKIKFLKKYLDNTNEKMENFVETFQEGFKEAFKEKLTLISSLLLKIIALILLYSMPFFAFMALGINIDASKIIFIISMSTFANVFMLVMPTPGASGGAEWAFMTIFVMLDNVDTNISAAATLIWRFFTYYLTLLLGFISVIFIRRKKNNTFEENEEL